jgi:hypothetical protein
VGQLWARVDTEVGDLIGAAVEDLGEVDKKTLRSVCAVSRLSRGSLLRLVSVLERGIGHVVIRQDKVRTTALRAKALLEGSFDRAD